MTWIQHVYVPSQRMIDSYGMDADKHAQDLTVIRQDSSGSTLAVVDGARNFIGRTEYSLPAIATRRGLETGTLLNGGEIVSSVFAELIDAYPHLVGQDLVQRLNQVLDECYQRLGIQPNPGRCGELLTGYVGHVRLSEKQVVVTSVGDCYVAINGVTVVGVEKEVDVFNASLIDEVAAFYEIDRQTSYQGIMPIVNALQFALQYDPSKAHWYPAIDGTETPAEGIKVLTYPLSEVNTIVLWTDGFTPVGKQVVGLDDLRPTNPQFGESTAIVATVTAPN